jgi:hypothetical protein
VVINDGKNLAIEIETGKPDAVYNVKKDLEAGFDQIVCITTSNKFWACLETKIEKIKFEFGGKLKIVSIDKMDKI